MQSAISAHLFLYHDLVSDGVIERIAANGFPMVELWAMQPHLPYRDEKRMGAIAAAMKKYGVSAASAHLPMYEEIRGPGEPRQLLSPSDVDENIRKRWIEETLLAARAAVSLGAKVLTLHTELDFPKTSAACEAAFHKSISAILEAMPPSGFSFAVENNIGGLIQIEGLIKLIARYPTDKIGITLDIGHAHIGGKVVDAVRVAAPRLLSVHAHDNDGAKDDHMVPGQGTAPWDDLKKALHAVNFNGPLVWEIRDPTAGNDPGLKVKSKILEETKRFDATFTRS